MDITLVFNRYHLRFQQQAENTERKNNYFPGYLNNPYNYVLRRYAVLNSSSLLWICVYVKSAGEWPSGGNRTAVSSQLFFQLIIKVTPNWA